MGSITKALFIIFAVFLTLSKNCYSTPIVSDLAYNSDGTVTISGQGFGTKIPAAPLLWETFDDPKFVPGIWLKNADSAWVPGAANGPQVVTDGCQNGGKCIKNHICQIDDLHLDNSRSAPNMWATAMRSITPSNEMYFSYNVRADWSGSGPMDQNLHPGEYGPFSIGKLGRIMTDVPGGSYNSAGAVGFSSWVLPENSGTVWLYNPGSGEKTSYVNHYGSPAIADSLVKGSWERHEIYERKSAPGVADGALYFAKAGRTVIDNNAILNCNSGVDYQLKSIYLPMSAARFQEGSSDSVLDYYVDNVYVDNTRARIEICESSSWQACTHKEIQIPASWSATQIKAKINMGTFKNSDTAYLFVIDKDGSVSNPSPINLSVVNGEQILPPSNLRFSSITN